MLRTHGLFIIHHLQWVADFCFANERSGFLSLLHRSTFFLHPEGLAAILTLNSDPPLHYYLHPLPVQIWGLESPEVATASIQGIADPETAGGYLGA